MCCLLLLPVLYLAFHVAQAAPAGPGDRETDWQHYLHGWSPQQSPISPSQHQGPWSGSSQSSVGLQHPAANIWSPANAPNSQFWGGHANDAQPSQSWDHALTPPYSFSTHDYSYTPPELKPEDLEFLHDALRDSDSEQHRSGAQAGTSTSEAWPGYVNNDQTHGSLYWGRHANDDQPFQPWNHALTRPYSFSPHEYSSTPVKLNAEELEFLQNALRDSDGEVPLPSARSTGGEAGTSANVVKNLESVQDGSSAISGQQKPTEEGSQVARPKRRRNRGGVGRLREPSSLGKIPYTEPLGSDIKLSGSLYFTPSEKLIQDISLQLFGGKLRTVDERVFHFVKPQNYWAMWPMHKRSRRLPLFSTTAADGKTKLEIYMTDNNNREPNKKLKGTVLENKRYYMFFGVPETLKAKNTIEYYGAGYINAEDHVAVDQHLMPLLRVLNQAAGTRP